MCLQIAGETGQIVKLSADGMTVQLSFPHLPGHTGDWVPCFIGEVVPSMPTRPYVDSAVHAALLRVC